MRVLTAVIAGLLSCAGAANANPVQGDENPCIASAGQSLSQRLIVCSETIASQTTLQVHIDARMERAKLYMSIPDRRRALLDYAEVVRRSPKFAQGYAALAEARAADGNIPGAIKEYDQALKLEPTNAAFWAGRCWMQARLGHDLSAALADCEHGIGLDPTAHYAHGTRAFVHLLQRDYQAAVVDFDGELALAAVADVGAQAYALYGRGIAKLLEGRDDGRTDLAHARSMDPTIGDQFRTWGFGP